MIPIFWITLLLIVLYLAYPLWLMMLSKTGVNSAKKIIEKSETPKIKGVSVILLSYNGKHFLNEKITFLIKELSVFENHEMIVIDDNSTDGSQEALNKFSGMDHLTIILNHSHHGIPHSMNAGVDLARYGYIIFCDQRQKLSDHILQWIIDPLNNERTGAVSGCISPTDKENRYSWIRKYENFVKLAESKTGSLMGVYGPFYSIKKQSYSKIPENIVLDDLYLSLKVLQSKQIELREDCRIFDENYVALYDYKRIRRYLTGFIQILKEKHLVGDLMMKHKIMLIWHKYLRLLIPLFIFLSYLIAGILACKETGFLILFCLLTALGIVSVLPLKLRFSAGCQNMIRLIILYFIGSIDILFKKVIRVKGFRHLTKP